MLPNELLHYIVSKMDGFERENMRLVCKMFNEFSFVANKTNPAKYREVSLINKNNIEDLFTYGHEDLVEIYARKHYIPDGLNLCYINNMHSAIKYFIDKDNCSHLFIRACIDGFIDIVRLAISKGANKWNYGLQCACLGGYMDIVLLMIENGANDWNGGLRNSCYSGNIEICKLMISKGANDFGGGFSSACAGLQKSTAKLMIENDAEWERILHYYEDFNCLKEYKFITEELM